jgi:Ima1 N-terminal domain
MFFIFVFRLGDSMPSEPPEEPMPMAIPMLKPSPSLSPPEFALEDLEQWCLLFLLLLLYAFVHFFLGKNPNENCWFCNTDQLVEKGPTGGWVCQDCHQSNGFDEAGDYLAPEPFCEKPQSTITTRPHRKWSARDSNEFLCSDCRSRQEY